LQEIDVRIVLERSSSGGDDTGAYRLAQSEGIADRYHCIPYGDRLGRPQAKRWQTARIDAEERNIGDSIGTDDLRDDLPSIRQAYSDGASADDDMPIRDDETIFSNDESRAKNAGHAFITP
jgi:hypothetical protein